MFSTENVGEVVVDTAALERTGQHTVVERPSGTECGQTSSVTVRMAERPTAEHGRASQPAETASRPASNIQPGMYDISPQIVKWLKNGETRIRLLSFLTLHSGKYNIYAVGRLIGLSESALVKAVGDLRDIGFVAFIEDVMTLTEKGRFFCIQHLGLGQSSIDRSEKKVEK